MLIEHRIVGSGKNVVICLSGFLYRSWSYDELIKYFNPEDFQFLLIENPGTSAKSSVEKQYTFDEVALAIKKIIDTHVKSNFWILGYSMGGFIAQKLAQITKDRLNGLMLMCTLSGGDRFVSLNKSNTIENIKEVYSLNKRTYITFSTSGLFSKTFKRENPLVYNEFIENQIDGLPSLEQAIFQHIASSIFLEEEIDFEEFDFPCLILSGGKDTIVKPCNSQLLGEAIADSKVRIFDNGLHYFFIEYATAIADLITKFIEYGKKRRSKRDAQTLYTREIQKRF